MQPTELTSLSDPVERFQALFRVLDKDKLHLLPLCYAPEIEFTDPFHRIEGLAGLTAYLERSYANVLSCTFTFENSVRDGSAAVLPWTMHLQHPRLYGGRRHDTPGCSHLRISRGLVVYHRDFFDAGSMLYEGVPLVGPVIRFIKGRL